ncbi:MAG: cytochrome b/b6 domain-containing protein [Eubacterium sp.]|nr:cytochrome b/b6 domain-containing protein [Eubacterium sp.]
MILDIAMVVLLPMLMAYSLIGETFHEVIGSVIFVLFIIHNILNRKWYRSIFASKHARNIFQICLNLFLFVFMILQPVSGILMSKHLYAFLPTLPVTAQLRSIHMILAYWGYVMLCVHAGTHLVAPLKKLVRKSQKGFAAFCVIFVCISVYGFVAWIRRGFPGYMSGRTMFAFFDLSEPRVFFFLDYIAIMVLFMMAGCLIMYLLRKKSAKRGSVK